MNEKVRKIDPMELCRKEVEICMEGRGGLHSGSYRLCYERFQMCQRWAMNPRAWDDPERWIGDFEY